MRGIHLLSFLAAKKQSWGIFPDLFQVDLYNPTTKVVKAKIFAKKAEQKNYLPLVSTCMSIEPKPKKSMFLPSTSTVQWALWSQTLCLHTHSSRQHSFIIQKKQNKTQKTTNNTKGGSDVCSWHLFSFSPSPFF